ncbi:class I SAM-dependent methyltransferase [Prauserella halophila]|uniref:Class I SAM-dependent methyltransferase n=1 Tax=Prauserella halophila TaxID=185641 RepID=A0ABN1W1S8_9PSEU|nr:class I SAM-dependent methyltransferase [Prauserella halophila]MCP2236446.1 hypothetical protein [Prauserella halophila]
MTAGTARRLLRAALCGVDDVTAAIAAVGPDEAADLVVSELTPRLRLSGEAEFDHELTVRLRMPATAGVVERDLEVGSGSAGWTLGMGAATTEVPAAVVTQDLAEVLHGIFVPSAARAATRSVHWRDKDDFTAFHSPPHVFTVVHRLLAAMDHHRDHELAALAVRYGSDKWGMHNYAPHYQWHFGPMRQLPITILEIGVGGYHDPTGGGASLRMWRDFFPQALVYGIDIVDKSTHDEGRVRTFRADQSDPDSLATVLDEIGDPDIIVDDGSHISKHVIDTFTCLFPRLRPGGKYVIEDLQTSYWPSFGGREDVMCDPATSMGMLKDLVDGLNHQELTSRSPRAGRGTDAHITGIHFHHNLTVIDKGSNLEPGPPSWLSTTRPD